MDQFCELGIQFLLFEMGLELARVATEGAREVRVRAGAEPGVVRELAVRRGAAARRGTRSGPRVLENVQSGIGRGRAPADQVAAGGGRSSGSRMTLSSSALGLQLLSDKEMMPTRVGTASLGVLLFQDLAVVPFIILLPLLQSLQVSAAAGAARWRWTTASWPRRRRRVSWTSGCYPTRDTSPRVGCTRPSCSWNAARTSSSRVAARAVRVLERHERDRVQRLPRRVPRRFSASPGRRTRTTS